MPKKWWTYLIDFIGRHAELGSGGCSIVYMNRVQLWEIGLHPDEEGGGSREFVAGLGDPLGVEEGVDVHEAALLHGVEDLPAARRKPPELAWKLIYTSMCKI